MCDPGPFQGSSRCRADGPEEDSREFRFEGSTRAFKVPLEGSHRVLGGEAERPYLPRSEKTGELFLGASAAFLPVDGYLFDRDTSRIELTQHVLAMGDIGGPEDPTRPSGSDRGC